MLFHGSPRCSVAFNVFPCPTTLLFDAHRMTQDFKMAVVMFGHLRSFEHTYARFKKLILDVYNPDVFMHTWDVTEAAVVTNTNSKIVPNSGKRTDRQLIQQMYQPKRLVIDTQLMDDSAHIEHHVKAGDVHMRVDKEYVFTSDLVYRPYGYCQFALTLKLADDLRQAYEQETQTQYDLVLAIRPDIFLRSFPIDLKHVELDPRSSYHMVSFFERASPLRLYEEDVASNHAYYNVLDVLFFSHAAVMSRVTRLADHIRPEEIFPFSPDWVLPEHIIEQGMQFVPAAMTVPAHAHILRQHGVTMQDRARLAVRKWQGKQRRG